MSKSHARTFEHMLKRRSQHFLSFDKQTATFVNCARRHVSACFVLRNLCGAGNLDPGVHGFRSLAAECQGTHCAFSGAVAERDCPPKVRAKSYLPKRACPKQHILRRMPDGRRVAPLWVGSQQISLAHCFNGCRDEQQSRCTSRGFAWDRSGPKSYLGTSAPKKL